MHFEQHLFIIYGICNENGENSLNGNFDREQRRSERAKNMFDR